MKQVLVHGPATSNSRLKLSEIRQSFNAEEVRVIESGNEQEILNAISASSLFSNNRLLILENPPEKILFTGQDNLTTIVCWFDKEVKVDNFPNFQVFFYPEAKEVSVFPFLDKLIGKQEGVFLELEKLKKNGADIFYILTMVVYGLRSIIYTPTSSPDFIKIKNAKLRQTYQTEEIISLYKFILELDFKLKSGLMEKAQAEVLLVSRFLNST